MKKFLTTIITSTIVLSISLRPVKANTEPNYYDARPGYFNEIKTGFEKWYNKLIISKHTPHHNGYDQIFKLGETQYLEGKFQYGDIRKDLENELVSIYVWSFEEKNEWKKLSEVRTNSDGRIYYKIPNEKKFKIGTHLIRLQVNGDGSYADMFVEVIDSKRDCVIFDIDGTLTKSDAEVTREYADEFFYEAYKAKEYEGSIETVNYYKNRGYEIIYLTARPYWLSDISSKWLKSKGYPQGILHTREEGIPLENARYYKRNYIREVQRKDIDIVKAYGNAKTDIEAYLDCNINSSDIYIIGENAGLKNTNKIKDYRTHLKELKN